MAKTTDVVGKAGATPKKVAPSVAKRVAKAKAKPEKLEAKSAQTTSRAASKKIAGPVARAVSKTAPAKAGSSRAASAPGAENAGRRKQTRVAALPPQSPVAEGVTSVASPVLSTSDQPLTLPMTSKEATLENGVTREDGRYALPSTSTIELPPGYRPRNDEEYMNPRHLAYFRNKLRDWRDQLVEESRQTMENLRDEVRDVGDEAERATRETENSLELRTRDRYRKLISKIDKALRRIEEGRYGFCEETDEEIGLERLDARPIATLSLDAQERREHLQKQMGD
ncbi:RNA polymerase-binding protein DksA [Frateuria aurantia]